MLNRIPLTQFSATFKFEKGGRGGGFLVPPSSQTLLPLGRTEPHTEILLYGAETFVFHSFLMFPILGIRCRFLRILISQILDVRNHKKGKYERVRI